MDNCIFCGEPAVDWPEYDGLDRFIRSIRLCDWHIGHALSACADPVYAEWKIKLSKVAEDIHAHVSAHRRDFESAWDNGDIPDRDAEKIIDNLYEIEVAVDDRLLGSSKYAKRFRHRALDPDGYAYDHEKFDGWLKSRIQNFAKKASTTGAHRCAAIRENGVRCVISVSKQGKICSKCAKSEKQKSKWANVKTLIPELIEAWEKS